MINTRAKFHQIIDLELPGAEVGAASGVFSLEILSWGISKLYLIDIWQHIPSIPGMAGEPQKEHDARFKMCQERMKDYPNAIFMKGLSEEMAKQIPDASLGFVYLDAAHDYQNVLNDLNIWVPKLVFGGVLGMHDFADKNYGVQRAAREFCDGKYKIHELPEDGKIENGGAYFINK